MDWVEIEKLQHRIVRLRDSGWVTLGTLEREAGVRRNWCRYFVGGTPSSMRMGDRDMLRVRAAINRMKADMVTV